MATSDPSPPSLFHSLSRARSLSSLSLFSLSLAHSLSPDVHLHIRSSTCVHITFNGGQKSNQIKSNQKYADVSMFYFDPLPPGFVVEPPVLVLLRLILLPLLLVLVLVVGGNWLLLHGFPMDGTVAAVDVDGVVVVGFALLELRGFVVIVGVVAVAFCCCSC